MAAWDLVGLILVLHHVLMVAANMEDLGWMLINVMFVA
uniref:Uncharacterized protein n=1 Tax=Daucus carota subsp. sativus TaxID=79200 RepID=A0A165XPJ6_DAUCS